MENKHGRIGIIAFLIIVVSTVQMHPGWKYLLCTVALISTILVIIQFYDTLKSTDVKANK